MVSALPKLLQPFELGPVKLRNRVFLPAHTTNFGLNNLPTQRNADYLAARAAGGVGLIITEAIRVHPSSAGRHISLGSFDDASIPAYEELTRAVHRAGGKIFAQIMHLGRQANGDATRTAPWGASPLPWAMGAFAPHAIGKREIDLLVKAFGDAAWRMQEAGFDGLEVHAGHGHLIQQFLSPATNVRTDGYGGSLINRMRFCREVLQQVYNSVPGLPVGVRVSVDEFLPNGMKPQDTLEFLQLLADEFDLTYIHASHSAYQSGYSLSTQMADMHFSQAPFIDHARLVKETFPETPVLGVCRIDTIAKAAEIVDLGYADMVGLARPHIADPAIVAKALTGKADTTTSCLACNQACIGRVELNLPISCVVNPEVGEERGWHEVRQLPAVPRADGRRVLVAGGGPAGMKAALAARQAGADVVLAEAGASLGGQIPAASSIGGRSRLKLVTDELARDIQRSGVEVRLNTRVTASFVKDQAFDHVIISTGSRPSKGEWSTSLPVVDILEAIELLRAGGLPDSGRVVILDAEGTWAAASLAEEVAMSGARVEVVSATPTLFNRITTYTKANLLDRLARLPVGLHLMGEVASITGSSVNVCNTVTGDSYEVADVSLIVDIRPPVANDELLRQLETLDIGIDIVGDANTPRSVMEAVYEGHRAGSTIFRDRESVDRLLTSVV
jgi:2,4-dienoyl-CoA reductase-like NADH-dependent reductase (Old Yellow Enzyme family)